MSSKGKGAGKDNNGKGRSKHLATSIVEAGRRSEWTQGIVNPPVWHASTILFDSIAEMYAAWPPEDGRFHYGRNGTPTQWSLAEALTELEPGAAGTFLFSSGLAAAAIALMSVLKPGEELLAADSIYGPTRNFCEKVLARQGIKLRYYDPLIGAGIEELIGDQTRTILMESPGSQTFEVQDVPAICKVAKARGIATLLDNTWATPLFFPAIAAGVDLAILACTKYIVGHADAMLGSVTVNKEFWPQLSSTARAFGQHVAPDDAYLASRGLRTLGVRLKQHEASALKIALWLKDQPQVARVLHPALPDCPGHAIWQRDFTGSSGLFSFVLKGGTDVDRTRFVEGLQHFGIGYSWGGYESLALPVDPHRTCASVSGNGEGPMVRLHIGLEDPADLISDLAAGLSFWQK